MKCIMCGNDAKKTVKKYIRDFGDFVLIVKNVPCYKCDCGEVYYDAATVDRLEKIENAVKSLTADEVVIVKYENLAA
ncbi:MAG: type II toxin-antitoxin system MqsA family antitoxin [Firmicutes bacterium]|nr:type II toxin-antitoxin system MqsA family antitoxin [Bacillota bacterium]